MEGVWHFEACHEEVGQVHLLGLSGEVFPGPLLDIQFLVWALFGNHVEEVLAFRICWEDHQGVEEGHHICEVVGLWVHVQTAEEHLVLSHDLWVL